MESLDASELVHRLSELMKRVEAGESFVVQISGRDAARLVPVDGRPRTVPWSTLSHGLDRVATDPVLAAELREILPDTTDDIE